MIGRRGYALNLTAGNPEVRDFGNWLNPLPDIAGYKWNDLDGDGVWDADEPGLNDWDIYLDVDDSNDFGEGDGSSMRTSTVSNHCCGPKPILPWMSSISRSASWAA